MPDIRTSTTHPLRIDCLDDLPVGLTIAPGQCRPSTRGYRWQRDLDADLEVLSRAGVTTLVCLLEDHELAASGIPELLTRAKARGLEVLRLPIPDGSTPSDRAAVDGLLDAIEARIAEGRRVAIHCMGGLGRTGTIAGCLLARRGHTAKEALAILARVRDPKCPETDAQRAFIARYAEARAAQAPAWYATDPTILARDAARAELEGRFARKARGAATALVAALEDEVARDPGAAFAFAPDGTATLTATGRSFAAGRFSTPSLAELRAQCAARTPKSPGRIRLSVLQGAHVLTDIGTLQASAPGGVLFQVASQFNCLEATSAHVARVREYLQDNTQGPRASISALPGTLLRHYAAPAPDGMRFVQTDARSLNLLADAFDDAVAEVQSGYLQSSRIHSPDALAAALTTSVERLRVGVHDDVDVVLGHDWDGPVPTPAPRIAQVFTSTIVLGGYGSGNGSAALVVVRRQLLRAAYVGTLLAAAALRKPTVVLTLIGGGVFGNPADEIWAAIRGAILEVEPVVDGVLHVVVNARDAELGEMARGEVRGRGGFLARMARDGVSIER